VPLDAPDFVLGLEVAFTVLDLVDFAVLGLLGQPEVALPVVAVPEQLARAPLEILDLFEHLDLVVGDRDALLLHDHPHVLVAGRERNGTALQLLVKLDCFRQLDRVCVRVLLHEHLAQV